MRLWVRLATLCLSLALLGGLLHDVAGARMSLDMTATAMAEQQEDTCPACAQEADEQMVCNFDYTAPLLSTETSPEALPHEVVGTNLSWLDDANAQARQPGFDPTPPRTIILS